MATKITSLYFDDTSIRLLVSRGERVKTWGKTRLKTGLIEDATVTDAKNVADQIINLLKEKRVHTRRIAVGISAQQCLTRQITLPVLPKNLISEAVIHEARRLLPLPPEELYLTWQTMPVAENKIEVFLVALRQKNTNPLFDALKLAKIKTTTLNLKPMALARMVKEPDAIMLDVQATEFDVVVIDRGIPNPMRTVSFPSPQMTWEEKTPIIIDEIERTIKFRESNNPDNHLNENLPIYISGDIIGQTGLCQEITQKFGFHIEFLNPDTDHPTGFNPQIYLTNIGLSKPTISPLWKSSIRATDLNLLPEEHRLKTVKWSRVLPVPVAMIFAGIALPAAILITGASGNINAAREQLASTNQVLQEKQLQKQEMKKEITRLEDALTATKLELDNCNTLLLTLSDEAGMKNTDLQTIIDSLTAGISLSGISITQTDLSINGKGTNEATILDYARALNDSQRFKTTNVSDISIQQDGTYSFYLILVK